MNKREQIIETFLGEDEESEIKLLEEKFDTALIGYVGIGGGGTFCLYDYDEFTKICYDECLKACNGQSEEVCAIDDVLFLTKATLKQIEEIGEDFLIANGFDEAIMGYSFVPGQNKIVIYNEQKCIDILKYNFRKAEEYKNMDEYEIEEQLETDATEYFCYNTLGAYVGEKTPGYAVVLEDD